MLAQSGLLMSSLARWCGAGAAERSQGVEIAADEGLLFRSRPAFELCLALACVRKRRTNFYAKKRKRRIECSRSAGLARNVVIKTLLQFNRRSDIEYSGSEAQKIDDRRAPRQARGHSPRFRDQHIHLIRGMPAAGHEQAVLGRRVEWLPGRNCSENRLASSSYLAGEKQAQEEG
jgi:hypothetical protein